MEWRVWLQVLHDAAVVMNEKQMKLAAAGIAYYSLIASIPVLLVSFIALTVFGGEEVAGYILSQAEGFLTPTGLSVVADVLMETGGRGGATLFSIAFFFWSAYEVFQGFDAALARINERERTKTMVQKIREMLTALFMIGTAVVVTAAVAALVATFIHVRFVGLIGAGAQFVLLTLLFIPLYYLFSQERYEMRNILPGAVVAAGGWTVVQLLFSTYITFKQGFIGSPIYEVFGGVLLFVIWLYIASLLLLYGASVNTAYRNRGTIAQP